ncbi:MAG: type III pantothenate kinase [Candidatus Accumulibacter sp. UW26]|jgi:type III pantothenate kinase
MIIAIDAGNSRIKWGIHDQGQWTASGVLATRDVAQLREVAAAWPAQARVVACNVAGAAVAASISSQLAGRPVGISFLQASAEACGVRSAYEDPGQLGADRWAALIGARTRLDSACLVVCAGTATTVDLLDASGLFRGGLILPGFDLMRAALARNTAQLPLADGSFRLAPCNTMDAIVSGCLQAQLGAIERMFAGIANEPGARCLLTGGAAQRLAAHVTIPCEVLDDLILSGLLRHACSL